jgi:hypothetical protein
LFHDYLIFENFCEDCQANRKFIFLTWADDMEGDKLAVYECSTCENEMILTEKELKERIVKAAK